MSSTIRNSKYSRTFFNSMKFFIRIAIYVHRKLKPYPLYCFETPHNRYFWFPFSGTSITIEKPAKEMGH